MNKIVILSIFIELLAGTVYAQQNNPIFSGGGGDGFSASGHLQPTIVSNSSIFSGSGGDGFSASGHLQPTIITTNLIFSGSGGDGFSSMSFATLDYINWGEEWVYNENGAVIGKTRSYSDGLGRPLQTQWKDYVSNKVFATQPLYGNGTEAVGQTLPAPMLQQDFIYNPLFASNQSGEAYSTNDFDKPISNNAPGEVNNPKPMGTQPGTVGWYYSANNNLEPNTPVTSYPYARSYSPEGPDPTTGKSSGPGNAFKMGSGHEAQSERQLITNAELSHYYALRPHFIEAPNNLAMPGNLGYKYLSTDPNGPNKKAVTFVDADGNTLATATLINGAYDNWSYTYYNDLGQVVATVAPQGVNTNNNALPAFVTYYKYDHLGRLIETTSPDEGTSRFVYSTDGKIRFSENQEQRQANPKRFSYTNYDYLGRLIESGEYTGGGTGEDVFEPHTTLVPNNNSVLQLVDNTGFTGISEKIMFTRCTNHTFIEYDVPGSGFAPDGLHVEQTNLEGQVSKTENEHTATWYSYDALGRLAWTKQNMVGLGYKTIDYTYDYFGNVTQVAYQKNQPDAFYHHYTYDINQRLTQALTSKDGITKTVQATYTYYLHGPLKRVVLGTNVQGIDYTYTIDGSLKTINHADPAKDPGGDGNSDVFGMTLQYYDNDYQGAGYSAGNQTLAGFANQYNGAVKGISWHSPGSNHQKKTYGYTYDNRYQLSNATFGSMTGANGAYGFSAAAGETFREGVPAYDKNGNILSLVRKGKDANTLANYSYVYEAATNRLDRVDHNGQPMADYSYNALGQMTQKTEAGVTHNITYTAYGLVKEIRNQNNQPVQTYTYDDRGDMVKKVSYNNGVVQLTTWYVNDASGNTMAIYTQPVNEAIQLAEVPLYGSGRVGLYKPAINTYFYEINDHLGNVRAVIGTPGTDQFLANMESENLNNQSPPFTNINPVVFPNANYGSGGDEVVRVNNANPMGPGISLKVSPGDVLNLEAYAYYEAGVQQNNFVAGNTLIAAIASAFGGINGALGDAGQIFSGINNGYGSLFAGGGAPGDPNDPVPPHAYLTYMVLDVNYVYRYGGYVSVSEAGNFNKEKLMLSNLAIDEPGYMFVYLYNRSNSANFVYFDYLKVTHQHSPIVAGGDYYPYGLVMEGREITDEPYRYGYQGQFSEKDNTTGQNEFDLRFYDAKIGRFNTTDPYGQFASSYAGMGNMPHMSVDPDGGWSWVAAGIGAAVGAGMGYAATGDWKGALIGGLAGGAIGGVSFNQSRVGFDGGTSQAHSYLKIKPSDFGKGLGKIATKYGGDILLASARNSYYRLQSPKGAAVVLDINGNIKSFDYGANEVFVDDGSGNLALFHDRLVTNGAMTPAAFSNGLTGILSGAPLLGKMNFDHRNLHNGKISLALNRKGITYNDGFLLQGAQAHEKTLSNGKFLITYQHINGRSLTVRLIRSILGVHEYYAHGISGLKHPKDDSKIDALVNLYLSK